MSNKEKQLEQFKEIAFLSYTALNRVRSSTFGKAAIQGYADATCLKLEAMLKEAGFEVEYPAKETEVGNELSF